MATRKTTTKKTTTKASAKAKSFNSQFEDFAVNPTAAVQENMEKMTESLAKVGEFSKANLEASVEAAQLAAEGVEKISSEAADFNKKLFEDSVEAAKKLSTARDPQAFIEGQTEFVRTAMEAQFAQFAKMSELMVDATRQSAEPMAKRYTAMVDMMQTFRG